MDAIGALSLSKVGWETCATTNVFQLLIDDDDEKQKAKTESIQLNVSGNEKLKWDNETLGGAACG